MSYMAAASFVFGASRQERSRAKGAVLCERMLWPVHWQSSPLLRVTRKRMSGCCG